MREYNEFITKTSHEHHCVPYHRPFERLLNNLLWSTSKKHQSSALLAVCNGSSPVTGEFPAQMASNAEYVSILWRHQTLRHKLLSSMESMNLSIKLEWSVQDSLVQLHLILSNYRAGLLSYSAKTSLLTTLLKCYNQRIIPIWRTSCVTFVVITVT